MCLFVCCSLVGLYNEVHKKHGTYIKILEEKFCLAPCRLQVGGHYRLHWMLAVIQQPPRIPNMGFSRGNVVCMHSVFEWIF